MLFPTLLGISQKMSWPQNSPLTSGVGGKQACNHLVKSTADLISENFTCIIIQVLKIVEVRKLILRGG